MSIGDVRIGLSLNDREFSGSGLEVCWLEWDMTAMGSGNYNLRQHRNQSTRDFNQGHASGSAGGCFTCGSTQHNGEGLSQGKAEQKAEYMQRILDDCLLHRTGSATTRDQAAKTSAASFMDHQRLKLSQKWPRPTTLFNQLENIKEAQREDGELWAIVQNVEDGKHTEFSVDDDGIVWFEDRLCVPNDQALREKVMMEAHSSPFTIHPAVGASMWKWDEISMICYARNVLTAWYTNSIRVRRVIRSLHLVFGKDYQKAWECLKFSTAFHPQTMVAGMNICAWWSLPYIIVGLLASEAAHVWCLIESLLMRKVAVAKEKLKEARSRQKSYADKHRRQAQSSIHRSFEILERIRVVSFRMALHPPLSTFTMFFHVSLLRGIPYHPLHGRILCLLLIRFSLICSWSEETDPFWIGKRELRNKLFPFVREILWKNHPEADFLRATETEESMRASYPHFFVRSRGSDFDIPVVFSLIIALLRNKMVTTIETGWTMFPTSWPWRNGVGPSGGGSGGDAIPQGIHVWIERFTKLKPLAFRSAATPAEAEDWITHMEKLFQVLGYPDKLQDSLRLPPGKNIELLHESGNSNKEMIVMVIGFRHRGQGPTVETRVVMTRDFRGQDQRFAGRNGNDRQGQGNYNQRHTRKQYSGFYLGVILQVLQVRGVYCALPLPPLCIPVERLIRVFVIRLLGMFTCGLLNNKVEGIVPKGK
ncbi:hypothetical protein Tco_0228320 [Tanacetum coccineum]